MLHLLLFLCLSSITQAVSPVHLSPQRDVSILRDPLHTVFLNHNASTFADAVKLPKVKNSNHDNPFYLRTKVVMTDHRVVSLDRIVEVIDWTETRRGDTSVFVLQLELSNHQAAESLCTVLKPGTLLVARARPQPLLRKVISPPVVVGSQCTVKAKQAHYTHIWRHADIQLLTHTDHFTTVVAVQDHHQQENNNLVVVATSQQQGPPADKRRQMRAQWGLSWVTNSLTHAWHAVKHGVEDIGHAVKVLYDAAKTLVTGHLDGEESINIHTPNWNYDESTGQAQGPITFSNTASTTTTTTDDSTLSGSVSCSNCYFHSTGLVTGVLKIDDYQLQEFSLEITASAVAHLEVDLKASYQWKRSVSKTFPPLLSTTFDFVVAGVPCTLSIKLPVELGASVQLDAEVEASFVYHAEAEATFGVRDFPHGNGSHVIHRHEYHHTLNHTATKYDVTVYASVYVQPTLALIFEHIGGPYAALRPAIYATLELSNINPNCNGVSLIVNAGVSLTLGAEIDITALDTTIWRHSFPAKTINFHQIPLLTKCYQFPDGTVAFELCKGDPDASSADPLAIFLGGADGGTTACTVPTESKTVRYGGYKGTATAVALWSRSTDATCLASITVTPYGGTPQTFNGPVWVDGPCSHSTYDGWPCFDYAALWGMYFVNTQGPTDHPRRNSFLLDLPFTVVWWCALRVAYL
eukprot:TRINITY_DN67162_c6_g4_i1.p1 TRINITY_DN67162_c6_g4~~TRINITY_DN67162_c6_g4_i1.p1  ORF type:complete len:692 (+),score=44.87 TRINITY_DN67162_c6_g4_i1:86-2161(+)